MKIKVPPVLSELSHGQLADLLYKLREERKVIEGAADEIKAEETRIQDYLIETLDKAEISRVSGKLAGVTLQRTVIPRVVNWDLLYEYVVEKKAFDLLQKRPGAKAFQERWDIGETVPGTEQFVSLNILTRKI